LFIWNSVYIFALVNNKIYMDIIEVFKDIPGYEGMYQVSDLGNVKSLSRVVGGGRSKIRNSKEILLKPSSNNGGYLFVSLTKEFKSKLFTIHRLVAKTFLNHNSTGYGLVVNHKDHNRKNNRLENLEIITQRQNANKKHLKSSSKYTGVCWCKRSKKWISTIKINGNIKFLGYFLNEIDAHNAYQDKLKELVK